MTPVTLGEAAILVVATLLGLAIAFWDPKRKGKTRRWHP